MEGMEVMNMKKIVQQDLVRIYSGLTEAERSKFKDSTILFTGGAGFLGFYFITFLTHYQQKLGVKKVICLDNFQVGYPAWLKELRDEGRVELQFPARGRRTTSTTWHPSRPQFSTGSTP